ncbi:MAG: 4-alpha-glucanotransferase [Gammaproteobacteria bacterium]|nr:4-alpha-glucanotransferase [Gammaproteobacteria bacterium]
MSITDYEGLDALCVASGIALDYRDIRGQLHAPGVGVKKTLLEAMHLPLDNDDDIERNLREIESRQWRHVTAAVLVHRQSVAPSRLTLILNEIEAASPIGWELCEESGRRVHGNWVLNQQDSVGETVFDGARLMRFEVTLPEFDNLGYHQLNIETAGGRRAHSTLIVAPDTCYRPPELVEGKKIWGVGVQLFSLRSKRNWGIGDFTDLHSLIEMLAPLGVNVLGLNPLHTLFSQLPEKASPYSPSSRDFLNPVYLDIEVVDEFKHDIETRQRVATGEFQAILQELRELELIDYGKVWAAKLNVLESLYHAFKQQGRDSDSERFKAFGQFQQDGGTELYKFALFEALQAFFLQQNADIDRWQKWPEAFRDPGSETVAVWAAERGDKIEFHQYLQWNAELQLAAVHEKCKALGMCIGIYRDLAVGIEKSSAQSWAHQPSYAPGMGVGAPPDDFNLKGQNWDLPPPQPKALGDQAYRSFIHTLRANMRHAGALRIDHIMGLMRLFWVPPECSPHEGTYVSYPFSDLLGILALESLRNHCLIIGEDLGTVPDDVRHALEINKIFSYRVLYFEKDWQRGTIRPPADYPRDALCTSGSHDLPTLRGFWQGSDLDLRDQLDLYPSGDFRNQQRQIRQQDRDQILAALRRESLVADEATSQYHGAEDFNDELAQSIQRYLARSQSMLLMVQLEDLLSEANQVNVPGTIDEYPNWRRKLSLNLEDWPDRLDLEGFAHVINSDRNA